MIIHWLYIVFIVLEIIVAVYLLLPLLLYLFYIIKGALVGHTTPLNQIPKIKKDFHFVAIVTAYKDSRFVPPLVDSLIKQSYPHVRVIVVADNCDPGGLIFQDSRVLVLRPDPPLHSKIKSIGQALDHFTEADDVLVIFDSDNLVHPNYFHVLNKYFQQGFLAVQTHMLSKNISTKYAKLDSIGHIYYTFLEREVRMDMGVSSCILGLGIALEKNLFKDILFKGQLGGFDKKLQADLVKSIPQLAFAKEAYVFDEKVDDGKVLEKQRTRWLYTYFQYFRIQSDILLTGIRRLNLKLAYFGFVLLRPPLLMLMGLALLFTSINFFVDSRIALLWLLVIGQFILTFILIILTQSRQKGMGAALMFIPLMILQQVKALFKMKQASQQYLVTEHSKIVYIDDIMKDEPV